MAKGREIMSIFFVSGDIFQRSDLDALAHGCNCAGAMGRGIAVEFRFRFPEMYAEYKRRCVDGRFVLGDVFAWKADGMTVFNLGTQKTWRTKAELSAIEKSVTQMLREAEIRGIGKIGIPRIGSGLGGLPWETVRALIVRIGERASVDLIVFEEYLPGKSVLT